MWILENDGNVLGGKRIWLRPGKKYLFGRTKPEGVSHTGFIIDQKSVSRRHLTLTVAPVNRGDSSKIYTRSEVTIVDEDTKLGTEVDGVRFKGGQRTLKNDDHGFLLGNSDCPFRLTWRPVILSFTFPSKETKAGRDPLAPTRALLEDLDIKTTILYVVEKTTHVVSSKRNTAKCLQALINGIHVVDSSYVDALAYAASPQNLDEFESLSPLEEDFDENWPAEVDYLPRPGKEPNSRPSELFQPDVARLEIFDCYTFIFCDIRQFENLQAPINNGGGKALYYEVEANVTTGADLVRHFGEVSGRKDGASLQDSEESRRVLLVRFVGEKGQEDWAKRIQQEAAVQLNRQLVEQNEFLDVILTKDPTKFVRTVTSLEGRRAGFLPASSSTPEVQSPGREAVTVAAQTANGAAPPRRSRTRGAIQSTFKGFDDGFDPSQVQAQKKAATMGSQSRLSSRAASRAVSQDVNDSVDDDPVLAPGSRKSKKRPAQSDIEEEDKIDNYLLPAAAAMKRRRLEEEDTARRDGLPIPVAFGANKRTDGKTNGETKAPKELNIQEVVREHHMAEDEAARRDEEGLHQSVSNMTVEEMKNLAVIQEWDLPAKDPAVSRVNIISERWDPRWNGRKNFKKFRRQGDKRPIGRGQTVIVPLVEVRKKSQGIGEQYWLESMSSNRRQRESEQMEPEQEYEEDEVEVEVEHPSQSQTFTSAPSHQEDEVPSELAVGSERQVIDADAPRATRSRDKVSQTSHRTETGRKRSAPSSSKDASSKRQKMLPMVRDSESDDELKFRFQKKG